MSEPILLSTWAFGQKANAAGWPYLTDERFTSLDAVEHACRAIEADPHNMTVGLGGRPDRSGEVSLDASIMVSPARCGSVCYVRRYLHPVTIARLVMEKSPHVMLAGDGADRFARLQGLEPVHLLTEAAQAEWHAWIQEHPQAREDNVRSYLPLANVEEFGLPNLAENLPHNRTHDTVGVLAQDSQGQLAGACSTSGLAFKVPGRVGDSPIIGHGLYVDPCAGAAVATGTGELMMGVCLSFLAVELMRRGDSPARAAQEALQRIRENYELRPEHQAAIITMAPSGRWSSAALRPGYRTAIRTADRDELVEPERVLLEP